MNEAELLLQINKHKSSAKMDAKERMIEQFLTKVYNYKYNKHTCFSSIIWKKT